MNLDFSDDQKHLQDEARKFFDKEGGLSNARNVMDNPQDADQELWDKIVSLGWTAIRIPEDYDGLGLGHLELCVIAEELGRSLAPVPFSSSVYFFTEALIKYANEEIKKDVLPKLVTGEITGTYGIAESSESGHQVTVSKERLNGYKIAVPDAGIATHMIVCARSKEGTDLMLVDLSDPSVSVHQQKNIDTSRAFFKVEFNDTPSKLVGKTNEGWDYIQHLLDQAAVLFAFEQVGGSQAALDMAKGYSLERFAFGRQIGSYQAIKHKLADMYIAITLAKSNCYYGAWALSSESSELSLAAATARVSATKAFQLCSKENIQTHGGNGFTWEYDCHLFYKRSKVLSVLLGSEATWKEKLVRNLEKTNTLVKE
jgi:alkylation response protein AidB-like acyl-CoA dehydrogenase